MEEINPAPWKSKMNVESTDEFTNDVDDFYWLKDFSYLENDFMIFPDVVFTPVMNIVDGEVLLKIVALLAHLDGVFWERILSTLEKYPDLFKQTGKLGIIPDTEHQIRTSSGEPFCNQPSLWEPNVLVNQTRGLPILEVSHNGSQVHQDLYGALIPRD